MRHYLENKFRKFHAKMFIVVKMAAVHAKPRRNTNSQIETVQNL